MWWHLTMIGAQESDGLVPDEDIASGRAVPGWTHGDPDPDVFVAWLEPSEPGPGAAVRQIAGRPSEYVMLTDPIRAWARMGAPVLTLPPGGGVMST